MCWFILHALLSVFSLPLGVMDWLSRFFIYRFNMSRLMRKPTKWALRPAKTQISLGNNSTTKPTIWPVCPAKLRPESSLSGWRNLRSLAAQLPDERTAKTLIRLGGCPGWSEFRWAHRPYCWFCRAAARILWKNWRMNWNRHWNTLCTMPAIYEYQY